MHALNALDTSFEASPSRAGPRRFEGRMVRDKSAEIGLPRSRSPARIALTLTAIGALLHAIDAEVVGRAVGDPATAAALDPITAGGGASIAIAAWPRPVRL